MKKYSIHFILHECSKFWCQWDKKEINTFIQQLCIKLIKSDSKDICNIKKKYIQFLLNQRILEKNHHGFKKNIKQHKEL